MEEERRGLAALPLTFLLLAMCFERTNIELREWRLRSLKPCISLFLFLQHLDILPGAQQHAYHTTTHPHAFSFAFWGISWPSSARMHTSHIKHACKRHIALYEEGELCTRFVQ